MRPVVGIVGAGQLARMAQQAAIPLAVDLRVLADAADDSAAQVIADVVVGDYRSLEDLRSFAKGCDVVTLDHELPEPRHLAALAEEGVVVRPAPGAKRFAQDKAHQRAELGDAGFPVPPFAVVEGVDEVEAFGAEHGWPLVLKAPRGGYDGRGVFFVGSPAEAQQVLSGRPGPRSATGAGAGTGAFLVEARMPLERELAVLVARRPSGEAVVYPLVETVQVDGILRELVVPARIPSERAVEARDLGLRIAEHIDVAGVVAIELFDTGSALLVNELACRPHNSGHWTIEGAATSQFANHLRGVLDWPLGAPRPLAPSVVTVNVLGRADGFDPADGLTAALSIGDVGVHLYGKAPRPGRKLGHVTALGDDLAGTRERARRAAAQLGEDLDA